METETKVLSATEVARELGVSVRFIYRQCKLGRIPCIKLGDRYLIPRVAFEEWLRGSKYTNTKAT